MYNSSVSRSYLDDSTCTLLKQNIALNDLYCALGYKDAKYIACYKLIQK